MSRRRLNVLVIGNHIWPRPFLQDHVDYPVLAGLAKRLGGRLDVITTSSSFLPGRSFTEWGSILYVPRVLGALGFAVQALVTSIGLLLRSRQERLIVSSDVMGGVVGSILATMVGLPFVCQIQGHTVDPGPEYGSRLKRRFISLSVALAVKRADVIRCLNETIEREVLRLRPEAKTVVLGSRVDLTLFSPGARDRSYSSREAALMTVGSLEPRKNHEILLRMLERFPSEGLQARLTIVGDGSELDRLQALAADLHVVKEVEFLGRLSYSRVAALLKLHDIFLFPSLSEGQPRSVLEAMASGLPVLAARAPGNESVIEDGISGLLLPAHDVDAWSHAVRRLMKDPNLRNRMARNGRARVCLNHDFESSLDCMADLFQTAVASQ